MISQDPLDRTEQLIIQKINLLRLKRVRGGGERPE